MTESRRTANGFAVASEIRSLARPLTGPADLAPLVDRVGANRFVCIGEASHGTHEYYRWRAELSRCLIEEHGFGWIGVESDWPDCWRINRWVRVPRRSGSRRVRDSRPLRASSAPASMAMIPRRM